MGAENGCSGIRGNRRREVDTETEVVVPGFESLQMMLEVPYP